MSLQTSFNRQAFGFYAYILTAKLAFFIMAIANEFGIPMPHVSNAIAANFDSGTTQKYAVEVVVMIISIVIDVFVFPLLQSGIKSANSTNTLTGTIGSIFSFIPTLVALVILILPVTVIYKVL